MSKLTITKIIVYSLSGENKRPVSGDVTFSDGKTYGWSNHINFMFHTSRDYGYYHKSYSFESKKRADLVLAALDRGEWEHYFFSVK